MKQYLEIKEVSNKTGLSISVVEYTIMKKNLNVEINEKGKRTVCLEEFEKVREGMTVGRNRKEKKTFDFDFDSLTEQVFAKGLTMTEFFREKRISRNRYYSIKSRLVYPTASEIEILKEGIKAS